MAVAAAMGEDAEPRRVRYESVLSSGESIRRDFETRLDTREPEAV